MYIQGRIHHHREFNDFRLSYLVEHFKKEMFKLQVDLNYSKKKADKRLLRKMPDLDSDFLKSFLVAFIHRCKLVNALAFMQFRCRLKNAEIEDLAQIFEVRKKKMFNTLEMAECSVKLLSKGAGN